MQSVKSAYLILKNIPKRDWSFQIRERRSVLGRSHRADIPIPAQFRGVSGRHAELWIDRYGIWVRDLGSKLGTNVNGVWVDHVSQARLANRDRVLFGTVEANVVSEDEHLCRVGGACDEAALRAPASPPRIHTLARVLSAAEIDVMLWLSRGYQSDHELGRLLYRSPHTVRTEIGNIFRKLKLHSRAELLAWIRRTGPL